MQLPIHFPFKTGWHPIIYWGPPPRSAQCVRHAKRGGTRYYLGATCRALGCNSPNVSVAPHVLYTSSFKACCWTCRCARAAQHAKCGGDMFLGSSGPRMSSIAHSLRCMVGRPLAELVLGRPLAEAVLGIQFCTVCFQQCAGAKAGCQVSGACWWTVQR